MSEEWVATLAWMKDQERINSVITRALIEIDRRFEEIEARLNLLEKEHGLPTHLKTRFR